LLQALPVERHLVPKKPHGGGEFAFLDLSHFRGVQERLDIHVEVFGFMRIHVHLLRFLPFKNVKGHGRCIDAEYPTAVMGHSDLRVVQNLTLSSRPP